MTYIITRLCRECVDTACVAVCPVDCIYRYTGADAETVVKQSQSSINEFNVNPVDQQRRLAEDQQGTPSMGGSSQGP